MVQATTIEQSKKLIELGIDVNTADMNYCNSSYKGKDYVGEWKLSLQSPQEAKSILDKSVTDWNTYWEIIPAWSLSALLDLIPYPSLSELCFDTKVWRCDIYYNDGDVRKHGDTFNSPIDATYSMLCYLLENKLIKY